MKAKETPSSTPPGSRGRRLESALLNEAGFSHGFFTRRGGVSGGPFESLNFSSKTGDSVENVEKNLSVVASDLGVERTRIYFASQVHGTNVIEVVGTERHEDIGKRPGDIVLTKARACAAAVRTADCVSILIACKATGWVTACHSGWKGCVENAAGAATRALLDRGATDLVAAIGPHISVQAFEVSREVADQLRVASPDQDIVDESFAKPHVNLRKMVRSQLFEAGIEHDQIDDVWGCTYGEPELFFSFRRDRDPSGRLLSAIVARGSSARGQYS